MRLFDLAVMEEDRDDDRVGGRVDDFDEVREAVREDVREEVFEEVREDGREVVTRGRVGVLREEDRIGFLTFDLDLRVSILFANSFV